MPNYLRLRHGNRYFFTLVSHLRRPILCDPEIRRALRRAIETVRAKRPFVVDALVLMPDHLRCIWTLPDGATDFSTRWMLIKRAVSRECKHSYPMVETSASRVTHRDADIWQRRFWEHALRGEDDFARHADYIHYNPVKHGLVTSPFAWPYSSIHRYRRADLYPADWTCHASFVDLEFD